MAVKTGLGKYLKPLLDSQNERGTSLLEVLAAIFIITTILAVVSPILFLVAANRVHTRNVEQAIDLAQEEIALIQARMIRGVSRDNQDTLLPPVLSTGKVGRNVAAPSNVVGGRAALPDSANEAYAFKIDVDEDGDPDFIVQTFRDVGASLDLGLNRGELAIFRMGVRVYSIAAEDNLKAGTGETGPASLQFGRGFKDRTTRPLAALYTEVSRSDLAVSLDSYEAYLNSLSSP